jgi:hypothetical protein
MRRGDGWKVSEGMRDGAAGKFEINEFEQTKMAEEDHKEVNIVHL